jgi:hypothetical protein
MAKDGVLHRLRRNLADFLDPKEGQKTPVAPARAETHAAAGDAPSSVGFNEQLKHLLEQTGQSTALSGRLFFIGLQKIKDRFGSEWERMAERAHRIARKTIERHLAPGDIFSAVQGVTFVIVFASLSKEQAQLKCVMIGDEIAKALLGENGAELLEVKAAVARIDGSFDLKSLPTTVEGMMASLADENADGGVDAVEDASMPATVAAQALRQELLGGLKFAYRPMWDQTRNVISTYRCFGLVPTSDVGSAMGDAECAIGGDDEATARLDEAVQQRVLTDLDDMMRDHRRLLLTLPVHFQTLASVARRRSYIGVLSGRLDAEARKLLVIDLAGVPDGVPQSRLVELITPLRQRCRGVMLRVALETADFTHVKGAGAAAVGCDIGSHPGPEFTLMQQMNRFNRAAAKVPVPTYLQGAQSLSQVAAALGAGFNYIDGEAVAKAIDHPHSIADFHLADLYRPFIRAEQAQILPDNSPQPRK